MKNKLFTFVLATFTGMLFGIPLVAAQNDSTDATGWKTNLVTDLTVTQTAYSDSWVGGEAGAASWVGNLNGSAEKQLSPSVQFRSSLKLSFGQTLTQDTAKVWSKPHKSTDLIDFENVMRVTKNWHVDPYAAFRLESQFVDASFESKKLYFTPLRLTESAGLARKFYEKDKEFVTSRLGIALRQTFTSSVSDPNTLATFDTTLSDFGIESVTDANFMLSDKMQYTGKLTLFKAVSSDADNSEDVETADYWKAVDANWENIVSAQLSKILAVNFYLQLLYDKEITTRARIKETLGLGFVFKLA